MNREKRIEQIMDKLQPYVNGKLITHVFVRYWDELKTLTEDLILDYGDYMRGDL